MNPTTLSRTQPALEHLTRLDQSGTAWLAPFLRLGSRAAELELPDDEGWPGTLIEPPTLDFRSPAPPEFLAYLLNHRHRLVWPVDADGVQRVYRPMTQNARRAFMQGNPHALAEALRGVDAYARQLAEGIVNQPRSWWALEGQAKPDAVLRTDQATIFIEARKDEKSLKAPLPWYDRRIQLYRSLDCLRVLPGRTDQYYLLLIVEAESPCAVEAHSMARDLQYARRSWPHLDAASAAELWTHFLGYTTWQAVAEAFPGLELE